MLQVILSFFQYEWNHAQRYHAQTNSNQNSIIESILSFASDLQLVQRFIRNCVDLKLKIAIICGLLENRLIHELREVSRHIWWGQIHEATQLIVLTCYIGFVYLVRSVMIFAFIWWQVHIVVDRVVKSLESIGFSVISIEVVSCIWERAV